jgi:hypothetical protein
MLPCKSVLCALKAWSVFWIGAYGAQRVQQENTRILLGLLLAGNVPLESIIH